MTIHLFIVGCTVLDVRLGKGLGVAAMAQRHDDWLIFAFVLCKYSDTTLTSL